MKTTSTLLLALALGFSSISTASAGLITDPLSVQAPVIDQGLTTDPLGQGGPKHISLPPANVPAAAQFLASVIAEGQTVRLSDLFLNPEFFAAAHASGPEADALRGQIDWLMLSGVILGFDGMAGSDDLFGGGGDDEVSAQTATQAPNGIILGGPGSDTLAPYTNPNVLQPVSPGIILGGPGSDTIILGGPGGDTLAPYINPNVLQPVTPGIILGGPGSDTIILGGPGSDTFQAPINGFVFGTTTYLK